MDNAGFISSTVGLPVVSISASEHNLLQPRLAAVFAPIPNPGKLSSPLVPGGPSVSYWQTDALGFWISGSRV